MPCKPILKDAVGDSELRLTFYAVLRLLIGVLLVSAGISKLLPMQPVVIGNTFLLPVSLVILMSSCEIALGLACFSMVPIWGLASIVIATFGLFIGVLIFQKWRGETSCSCFGSISPPIYWMFFLDGAIFVTTIALRRNWSQIFDLRNQIIKEQIRNLRVVAPLFLVAGFAFFGSIDAFLGYVSGAPVVFDARSKVGGTTSPNERSELVFFDATFLPTTSHCRELNHRAGALRLTIYR